MSTTAPDDVLEHDLELLDRSYRTRLSASAIDAVSGVLRGCTAAQADVLAAGKFVLLDASGKVTRDPSKMARKLPVYTDDRTLETLLAAVEAAGGVLKVRSDHDDSLAARAGFADGFRLVVEDGKKRVATDLHLARSYRDREIFLETAKTTPSLVGLSIDFLPEYELEADRALMRVAEVYAVDIVDEGAITRDGLFLSRRVDNRAKFAKQPPTQPDTTMADEKTKEPTMSEVLAQMTSLATGVKSCMECLASIQKTMSAAAVPPTEKKEEVPAELSALTKEAKETLAAVKNEREALAADRANLAKERSALGLKNAPAAGAADDAAEAERARLAAEKGEGSKTYLDLVKEAKASGKFAKGSEAHEHVMKTHPEKYRAHLSSRGVYDQQKETAQASR